MKRIYYVYNKYYVQQGKTGMDFLNDAHHYLNVRNEICNENKSVFKLLIDFCIRVEMFGPRC